MLSSEDKVTYPKAWELWNSPDSGQYLILSLNRFRLLELRCCLEFGGFEGPFSFGGSGFRV